MSVRGTLQTFMPTLSMSALEGKADIPDAHSSVPQDPKADITLGILPQVSFHCR